MRVASALGAAVLTAVSLASCSLGEPAAPSFAAEQWSSATYHRDVAPILARSCVKCHNEGGIGPFSLSTYEMAQAMAPVIIREVSAGRMPPWGAHDTIECVPPLPWRDDERLSEDEIRTLEEWERAGAPEGNRADAPADDVRVRSLDLDQPTLDLAARTAYQPTISSGDELRCFAIDAPDLAAGGFVSAIHVVPGNRKIVHHVSVYADVGGVASRRAGADGSFDCSADAGGLNLPVGGVTPQLTWLLAWAPGGRPLELPEKVGVEIRPGSNIVIEVHYSMTNEIPEPDRTRVQLTLAGAKPEFKLSSWGFGNFREPLPNGDGLLPGPEDRNGVVEFRIPANATSHVEQMQQTVTVDAERAIFGVRPHAHLAAVDIKVDLLRGGVEQCLVQDRWDFHWQRVYSYDAPTALLPTVRPGDKVRLRCTYDNSMQNRRLANELWARGLQPMDIRLGDWSMEEMCMADLLLIEKNP